MSIGEQEETDPTANIVAQSSADKEIEDSTQKSTKKIQPVLVPISVDEDDDDDLPALPPPCLKKSQTPESDPKERLH